MTIIERPCISGEGWFYILDDKENGGCGENFLLAPNEFNSNGKIKCEYCPNICRKEDIAEKLIDNIRETWSPDNAKEEQK